MNPQSSTYCAKNEGRKWKAGRLERKMKPVSDLMGRINELEHSDNNYVIKMGANIDGAVLKHTQGSNDGGITTYNILHKTIDINILNTSRFNPFQILAHELTHGSQFERKQLVFGSDGITGGNNCKKFERQTFFNGNLFSSPGKEREDEELINKPPYSDMDIDPRITYQEARKSVINQINAIQPYYYNGWQKDLKQHYGNSKAD